MNDKRPMRSFHLEKNESIFEPGTPMWQKMLITLCAIILCPIVFVIGEIRHSGPRWIADLWRAKPQQSQVEPATTDNTHEDDNKLSSQEGVSLNLGSQHRSVGNTDRHLKDEFVKDVAK